MRVPCEVTREDVEDPNSGGELKPGVTVLCTRCERVEQSFGQHEGSIRRCFVLLRENCDMAERNFYFDEEQGEDD